MLAIKDPKEPKIINQFPVQELWAGHRLVSTIRVCRLNVDEVENLLNLHDVRLVVAEIGKELCWIPNNARFDFWFNEVKPHLAALTEHCTNNTPTCLPFYLASQWHSYNGDIIVLIEKQAVITCNGEQQ